MLKTADDSIARSREEVARGLIHCFSIPEAHVVAVVWNFEIVPAQGEEFERFYGADGEWTALSRRSRSFLGSSLR
jgi:hypothetical protein